MILQGTFAPRSHSAGSGRAAFTLLPLWSPMSLPAAESAVVETGGNCGAVGGHWSCRCGWWCEGILAVLAPVESIESWKWGKLMDEVATVWGRFAAAGSVGLGPRHLPWRWEWPRIWPSGTPESYLASPGADAFRKLKRRTLDSNRGVYLYVYATSKANKMKRMSKVNGTPLIFPICDGNVRSVSLFAATPWLCSSERPYSPEEQEGSGPGSFVGMIPSQWPRNLGIIQDEISYF